jgi:hypothetical protein
MRCRLGGLLGFQMYRAHFSCDGDSSKARYRIRHVSRIRSSMSL